MKIRIKVRVYSQAIPDQIELELEEGSSVDGLLCELRKRFEEGGHSPRLAVLANTGSLIVLLNGMSIYSISGWETVLHEGDHVSFLPMVAGG